MSRRAPIWLCCFLTHYYHPVSWVATFDSKIGAVIVEFHSPKYKVEKVVEDV
ncbi:MAG: CRISPR-associated ring nuclease Crn3/Csx3 [Candidatus Freyarchaeota archaeon]